MLLRTRITLILLAVVAALLAGVVALVVGRDRAAERRVETLQLQNQETVFDEAVGSLLRAAQAATTALLQEPGLANAVIAGDRDTLRLLEDRIRRASDAGTGIERIDVFAAGGDLLYSTDVSFFSRVVLGDIAWSFLWVDAPTFGARILDGALIGVAAAPIVVASRRVGTSVTTVGLAEPARRVEDILDARLFVTGRGGDRVAGTDGELWRAIAGARERRDLTQRPDEVAANGRRWRVGAFDLADIGGGTSATVYVARDVTEAAALRELRNAAVAAGLLVAAVMVLLLLYLYLRSALRPLDDGIEALNALSAGNTDHYAELPSGRDEVGQIGRAIDAFRTVALAAARAADERERRRARQARFIRQQMATLSQTLEGEARDAALDDIREIEAAAEADRAAIERGEGADELGLIAVALERMTERVRDQQDRLADLVAELREALAAKMRLVSLEQELDIARGMQQSVLPRTFPEFGDASFEARMRPAREVGGDFYDAFLIDRDHLGLVIADVSGKGVPAAFFMLIARTLMRAIGQNGGTPGETLVRLNDLLSSENEQMLFVTAFYGVLERGTGRLVYANAGHNPPIIRRADGALTVLRGGAGIALAVMEGLAYEDAAVELCPGDGLVLYTDGVTEAMDPASALFGEDRLAATVRCTKGEASGLIAALFDAVDAFSAGEPQADDITALAVVRSAHDG